MGTKIMYINDDHREELWYITPGDISDMWPSMVIYPIFMYLGVFEYIGYNRITETYCKFLWNSKIIYTPAALWGADGRLFNMKLERY